MASFGMEDRHPPVTEVQYLSDGDTIPYIAAGGEKVGDVVDRVGGHIGVVSSLDANNMSGTAMDGAASADDRIALRLKGIIRGPVSGVTAADGARCSWGGSDFAVASAGAHEFVGAVAPADTYAWVRINVRETSVT